MVENVATTYERPSLASDAAMSAPRKHLSWGAVLAGVIVVLAIQLLLSLLGVGVGASTIDPTQGNSPEGSSLGIGAGIWWLASALIALFAGSWVAGRLAGVPIRTDGLLHGIVTWGLATLVLVYLLTTTISGLIGGAFGIVGSAMQTAGQVAGAAGAAGAGAASQNGGGDTLGKIQQQADQLLGRLSPQTQQTGQQIQQAVSDPNVRGLIQRVVSNPDAVSPADREAAVSALVTYGGMSRPDAERQLNDWQQGYRNAEQKARQAGEATANAVSQGSLWSFAALALGAIVAAIGGMQGAPRSDTYVEGFGRTRRTV